MRHGVPRGSAPGRATGIAMAVLMSDNSLLDAHGYDPIHRACQMWPASRGRPRPTRALPDPGAVGILGAPPPADHGTARKERRHETSTSDRLARPAGAPRPRRGG